jgi:photosystem II stability/assembly factor-like uncharacterized protein
VPTIAVTGVDTETAAVNVAAGSGTTGYAAIVERSDDDGDSWVKVRGTEDLVFVGGTAATIDYEAPPNTPILYRATQQSIDAFGNVYVSAPSSSVAAMVPNRLWRLKDPIEPDRSIVISQRGSLEVDRKQPTGVFEPLNRGSFVVLKGMTGGQQFSLSLNFRDQPAWEAFNRLRDTGRTLLLQSDMTDSVYVRLGEDRPATLLNTQQRLFKPFRTVDITAYEVDRPAG